MKCIIAMEIADRLTLNFEIEYNQIIGDLGHERQNMTSSWQQSTEFVWCKNQLMISSWGNVFQTNESCTFIFEWTLPVISFTLQFSTVFFLHRKYRPRLASMSKFSVMRNEIQIWRGIFQKNCFVIYVYSMESGVAIHRNEQRKQWKNHREKVRIIGWI